MAHFRKQLGLPAAELAAQWHVVMTAKTRSASCSTWYNGERTCWSSAGMAARMDERCFGSAAKTFLIANANILLVPERIGFDPEGGVPAASFRFGRLTRSILCCRPATQSEDRQRRKTATDQDTAEVPGVHQSAEDETGAAGLRSTGPDETDLPVGGLPQRAVAALMHQRVTRGAGDGVQKPMPPSAAGWLQWQQATGSGTAWPGGRRGAEAAVISHSCVCFWASRNRQGDAERAAEQIRWTGQGSGRDRPWSAAGWGWRSSG